MEVSPAEDDSDGESDVAPPPANGTDRRIWRSPRRRTTATGSRTSPRRRNRRAAGGAPTTATGRGGPPHRGTRRRAARHSTSPRGIRSSRQLSEATGDGDGFAE
eukprot:CAMPEP_0194299252 /NCGR_PEP_ID=MMETSP0169-20130528/60621_1 /TAXON_ID=218684 /ORGANISM="Corethron pennatum, Strain L29A3" /LENGTH=103 /DNA_ID=CAMNT_0039049333 /DNA_START=278 /DNA_END=589 /DNA_ORIENTATION=-